MFDPTVYLHISALHPSLFFFFNDTATTEIYTLSLHDALPISQIARIEPQIAAQRRRRRPITLGELVQDAHLRQRERALVRPLAQHADLPGVEPVEAARRLHPLLQLARRHATQCPRDT